MERINPDGRLGIFYIHSSQWFQLSLKDQVDEEGWRLVSM